MAMQISSGDLSSRTVREAVGERRITSIESLEEPSLLGRIWESFKQVAPWLDEAYLLTKAWITRSSLQGFLVSVGLQLLAKISISFIVRHFLASIRFLWRFNWTASDQQLLAEIKARRSVLAAQLGALLGCSVGHILCGRLGSTAAAVIRLPKGAILKMQAEATEEAIDEFTAGVHALGQSMVRVLAANLATRAYMNIRNFVSGLGSDDVDGKKISGDNQDAEPWIAARKFEEKVIPWLADKLPGIGELFLEEFFEEMGECCSEILLVMASSADSWREEQRDTREAVLGVERTVELQPDRENPTETIVLTGREQLLRPQINQALINHQLLHNRDVGQIVGRDLTLNLLSQPITKTLFLTLHWGAQKQPPYTPLIVDGKRQRVAPTFQLPYLNPAYATWDRIKRAMGGAVGYKVGRFRAYGHLGRIKVEVWGDTEANAIARLEALAELSLADLRSVGTSTKVPTGTALRNQVQYYPVPVQVYPAWGFVVARRYTLDAAEADTVTIGGKLNRREERFELWPTEEPSGYQLLFQEMVKHHSPVNPDLLI